MIPIYNQFSKVFFAIRIDISMIVFKDMNGIEDLLYRLRNGAYRKVLYVNRVCRF